MRTLKITNQYVRHVTSVIIEKFLCDGRNFCPRFMQHQIGLGCSLFHQVDTRKMSMDKSYVLTEMMDLSGRFGASINFTPPGCKIGVMNVAYYCIIYQRSIVVFMVSIRYKALDV